MHSHFEQYKYCVVYVVVSSYILSNLLYLVSSQSIFLSLSLSLSRSRNQISRAERRRANAHAPPCCDPKTLSKPSRALGTTTTSVPLTLPFAYPTKTPLSVKTLNVGRTPTCSHSQRECPSSVKAPASRKSHRHHLGFEFNKL